MYLTMYSTVLKEKYIFYDADEGEIMVLGQAMRPGKLRDLIGSASPFRDTQMVGSTCDRTLQNRLFWLQSHRITSLCSNTLTHSPPKRPYVTV